MSSQSNNYRELFFDAPIAYVIVNGSGRIIKANLAAETCLLIEEKALLQHAFRDFISVDDRTAFDRTLSELRTTGQAASFFLRIVPTDQSIVQAQVSLNGCPCDAEDSPHFRLCFCKTEDLPATSARLRKERKRLRFQSVLLDSIGEAVIATDVRGTILYWNKAAELLYGWSAAEVMYRNILETTVVEENLKLGEEIMATLRAGQVWSGEFLVRHRDGHTFYAQVTDTSLSDEKGEISVIIGVSFDLSEKKRIEKEKEILQELILKQVAETAAAERERAESENQFKSEFIANMSHEIRTPLATIRGYAELMKEDRPSTEKASWAEIIVKSSKQLELLVNDILDISKINAGKIQVEHAPVHLRSLLEDIRNILSLKASEQGIALIFTDDGHLPALIHTDPLRLKQILLNVVGNAIKFTSHGRVLVNTTLQAGGEQSGDPSLVFTIEDTGIGVDPETASHIFEAFNQGDQSINRRFGGTGLGLPISLGLARLLGGDIVLSSSRVKGGSTFIVTINPGPLANSKLEAIPAVAATHSPFPEADSQLENTLMGSKILVAEDAADIRALVDFLLSSRGASVVQASNGEEALRAVHEQGFDMIIMDIQMPVMDGYEAVVRLRKEGYAKPIFALTAHVMAGEKESCLAHGFSGYLAKPIDVPELVATLARAQDEAGHSSPP